MARNVCAGRGQGWSDGPSRREVGASRPDEVRGRAGPMCSYGRACARAWRVRRYGEKLALLHSAYYTPLSQQLPPAQLGVIFSSFVPISQCQSKFEADLVEAKQRWEQSQLQDMDAVSNRV